MIRLIQFRAMGCHIAVQLDSDDSNAEQALAEIPARVAELETRLTRFQGDSELMRLNARAGEWVHVSETLFAVIGAAKHAARMTEGLYNPLVLAAVLAAGYDRSFEQVVHPHVQRSQPCLDWRMLDLDVGQRAVRVPPGAGLDLGGIAKGWTARYLADQLSAYGACLVNLGGDIAARGAPRGLPGWPVAIEDPFTGEPFLTIGLSDRAIATSGRDYRRWHDSSGQVHHHIIDPRTGESARTDVIAASVVHPNAVLAEAYAKAVMIHGAHTGLEWLDQQWEASGLVFREDSAVLATGMFVDVHMVFESGVQS